MQIAQKLALELDTGRNRKQLICRLHCPAEPCEKEGLRLPGEGKETWLLCCGEVRYHTACASRSLCRDGGCSRSVQAAILCPQEPCPATPIALHHGSAWDTACHPSPRLAVITKKEMEGCAQKRWCNGRIESENTKEKRITEEEASERKERGQIVSG